MLEAAQLRSLDPPERADMKYFRIWLDPEVGGQDLSADDRSCWEPKNDDDLITLQSQLQRENRILSKLKMIFQVLNWKIMLRKEVGTESQYLHRFELIFQQSSTTLESSNVIHLGKDRSRVSRMKAKAKQDFTSRLIMALFGGIALIVPTVIMAKLQGVNASLITTAIATVVFASVVAVGATDASGKDVLAATAAYAGTHRNFYLINRITFGTTMLTTPKPSWLCLLEQAYKRQERIQLSPDD